MVGQLDTIAVDELRQITEKLLNAIGDQFGQTIELGADYYWHLDPTEAYDMAAAPTVMAGQLTDDLAELRARLDSAETFLWHDLAHLVGVLAPVAALARPRLDGQRHP